MNTEELFVSDNSLKMKVACGIQQGVEIISPLYKLCFTEFQLKAFLKVDNKDLWSLMLKFKKCYDDELLYTLKINSERLDLDSKTFISDDSDWRLLGNYSIRSTIFIIEIEVGTKSSPYLRSFFDDDFSTDFEMKGIDGSIRVHKIVLAEASQVFEKMITNDFKEKKEAQVTLPYTKDVLKDFKEYLYLNTLNNDNLKNLLMLSHCYMIKKLKQNCINKLLYNITRQKSLELIEFAVENKITELLVGILRIIEEKALDFKNYEIISPGEVERQMEE